MTKISVFLCTNLGNGPAGTQPCPAGPATISGVITAADVSPNIPATAAARTQGVNTGEIAELVAAMRAGATYVNIHSTTWPGGEVRSQIDGNNSHNHRSGPGRATPPDVAVRRRHHVPWCRRRTLTFGLESHDSGRKSARAWSHRDIRRNAQPRPDRVSAIRVPASTAR